MPSKNEIPVKQCPSSGTGVHAWLFHAACAAVEAGWPDEVAVPWIRERMTRAPEPSHEIEDALASARREDRPESRKWSARDLNLIQTIKNGVAWSPNPPNAATLDTLRLVFPGDPLVCIGRSQGDFTTGRISDFKFLDRCQFIVPNAMTEKWGTTKKGHRSQHSLDNTGPRQYMVVEFDWGPLELQLKIHRHLATKCKPGRLVMVVHSGSKSAHGWYDFRGEEEEGVVKNFFDYAIRCGADPRLWLRSQFCRLPGGTRDDGRPQTILYLDRAYLEARQTSFVSISP